jgi:rubrerythrin
MERVADVPRAEPRKLDLSCAECGYGVLRSTPPERCPMCQTETAWIGMTPAEADRTVRLSLR